MALPVLGDAVFHVENCMQYHSYQNYFTIFQKYVIGFVYIRLKRADFKTECTITVFF